MRTIYNRYSAFATLSLLCLILFTCKQHELGDTGFPRVRTLFVEMISDTGAVFKGEIMDIPADCEVLDHGFVWTEYPGATTYVEKVSLGSTRNTGEFKASASRAMAEGKKYYFKSFVQTPTLTIFGNELDFISLGSHKPEITSISPSSGSWSDTIVIHGKHFSNSTYQMYVMFGNKTSQNISSTSTEIRTIVPPDLDTANCKLGIKYANVLYPGEQVFTLVPNVTVTSIEPASGSWNTVVKIRGKNLKYAQGVFFNNIITTLKSVSDTVAEAVVPYNLNSAVSDVAIKINSFQFRAPQKFTFIPGKVKSIIPETGTTGTQVTIKTNNIRTIYAKVSINGKDAPVKSKTDSTLTVTMPLLYTSGNFPIVISDGSFTITYENAFEYRIPEVTSVSDAIWGDTITITGKNFDVFTNWTAKYGTSSYYGINATITSVTSKNLKILFPANHDVYYNKIYLSTPLFVFPSLFDLKIKDPIIEEVIGPSDDFSDPLVTIKGKYFNPQNTSLRIIETDQEFNRNSQASNTSITYHLPPLLRGIYSIKLAIPGTSEAYAYNSIVWNGPLSKYAEFSNMTNYYDMYFLKGEDNKKFYTNIFYNGVYTSYKFDHDSKSYSTINSKLPELSPTVIFEIGSKSYLCTGYKNSVRVNSFYEFDPSSQTYSNLPDFPSSNYIHCGFSYNNKAYIICEGNNYYDPKILWTFDFNSKTWSSSNQNLSIDKTFTTRNFTLGEYIYIFNDYSIYKFNPTNNQFEKITNTIERKSDHLGVAPFYFKDNILYARTYGIGYDCQAYNVLTNTWKKIFNFPSNYSDGWYSYSIGDKCYRVSYPYNSRMLTIIEFDPSYLK